MPVSSAKLIELEMENRAVTGAQFDEEKRKMLKRSLTDNHLAKLCCIIPRTKPKVQPGRTGT